MIRIKEICEKLAISLEKLQEYNVRYKLRGQELFPDLLVDETTYCAFCQAKRVEEIGVIAASEEFLKSIGTRAIGKKKSLVLRRQLLVTDPIKHREFLDALKKHNAKYSAHKPAAPSMQLDDDDLDFLDSVSPSAAVIRVQHAHRNDSAIVAKIEALLIDPLSASVRQLDDLAKEVANCTFFSADRKCQLLTKLDRIYLARMRENHLNGKSKQYCHKFRLSHGMVDEDPKGYGSLCIGHSRRPR